MDFLNKKPLYINDIYRNLRSAPIDNYFSKVGIFNILVSIGASSIAYAKQENDEAINVVASSSLGSVIADLARDYSRESGVHISVNFGNPTELAKSIFEGARADVFISEDPEGVESLKREGIVDVFSAATFAETSLEIVCGGEKPDQLTLEALVASRKDSYRLAYSDPDESPLGLYAKEMISKLKPALRDKDKLTEIGSIESLEEVVGNEEICGVFYSFFNMPSRQGLWRANLDESIIPQIKIKAAVVAGENMKSSRAFVEYLKSPQAEARISASGLKHSTHED